MRIDHVGIAVRDLKQAIEFYRGAFHLEVSHREDVVSQHARVAFLAHPEAECCVELMEPMGESGAVARFLSERGPGMHHLAFRSDDIAKEMRRLSDEKIPPMENQPRPGARGHSVCFIHPKHAGGVLVELVEAHG